MVNVGLDNGDNGSVANDAVLQEGEVDQSVPLCNPEDTDNTPVNPVYEVVIANRAATVSECPWGGEATDIGEDDGIPSGLPNDQKLDEEEVDTTLLQCDEAPPPPPVTVHERIFKITDALLSVCSGGGTTVHSGLDNGDGNGVADDGILQNGEIDAVENRCKSIASVRSLDAPFGRISAVPSMRGNSRLDVEPPVFDPNSPYITDKPILTVHDLSAAAFHDVNQLLCLLNQTKYREMHALGHTTYTALVSLISCPAVASLRYDALVTAAFYNVSSDPYDPVLWTLQTSGEKEHLPIKVRFWGLHAPGWDPSSPDSLRHITGEFTLYKAPTENNPLGTLELHARSEDTGGSMADVNMLISLKSSQNALAYGSESIKTEYIRMRPSELLVAATMFQDPPREYGHGTIDLPRTSGFAGTDRFIYRYTPTEFKRRQESYIGDAFTGTLQNTETLRFDRTAYTESAFGYGTYNMQGNRVQAYTLLDSVTFNRLLADTRDGNCLGATCTAIPRTVLPNDPSSPYAYTMTTAEVYENRRRAYKPLKYQAMTGLLYAEKTIPRTMDDLTDLLWGVLDPTTGNLSNTYVRWNGTDWTQVIPSNSPHWTRPPFQYTSDASTDLVLVNPADNAVHYHISANHCDPAPLYGPNGMTCIYTSTANVVETSVSEQFLNIGQNSTLTLKCTGECVDPRTLATSENMFYPAEQATSSHPQIYLFDWKTYTLTQNIDGVVYTVEHAHPEWHPSINMALYTDSQATNNALLDAPGGAQNLPERWRWKSGENKGERFMYLRTVYDDLIAGASGIKHWDYLNGTYYLTVYGFQAPVGGIPLTYINLSTNEPGDMSVGNRAIPSYNIPKDTLIPWRDNSFLIMKPMLIEQRLPLISGSSSLAVDASPLPTLQLYEQRINTDSPYVCGYPAVKYGTLLNHAEQPITWHYDLEEVDCPESDLFLMPEWQDVHNRYTDFECNYTVIEDGFCDWMCPTDTVDCAL